ncbi:hypothetical protein ACS0TY_021396 [Phlomoides rotata]
MFRERKSGERVRNWVEVRNQSILSERYQVRQKPTHFPYGTRLGDPTVEYEQDHIREDDSDTFWDKKHSGGDKGTQPYFFVNFPERCSVEFLRSKFTAVGVVLDIFCPKKKDKKGKPFGFVRFSARMDSNVVLEKLNNMWIGTYKIRAYLPRNDANTYAMVVEGKSDNKQEINPRAEEVLNYKASDEEKQ